MKYTQLTTESKMTKDLIRIIESVKEKITDNSDVVWTGYNTAKELRKELEKYIDQLKIADASCPDRLHTHFLPTGTFQEHSISNGWSDEYMKLSEKFDAIFATMKSHS